MSGDDELDPDRAAILARRRRFIALAISGLATTACKRPSPEPCLSVPAPEPHQGGPEPDPSTDQAGPFVEAPGAPLEADETGETPESETGDESGVMSDPTPPEVCLKIAAPPPQPQPQPKPKPCLEKRPPPHPCLMVID